MSIAAPSIPLLRHRLTGLVLIAALVLAVADLYVQLPSFGAEAATKIPAPIVDETAPSAPTTETAVLAGGCFWGVQGVFQHTRGVTQVLSGYSGGPADKATYDQVSTGRTGHAESVQIRFDPRQVSYGKLLQIYFSVVHDPTQVNRQGPDTGTQYRSAIFTTTPQQKDIAERYIAQLNGAGVFRARIATELVPEIAFYPAEDYHQDYLTLHPESGYIVYNDLPKVANLKAYFPDLYRDAPMLVSARASGR